MSSVRAAVLAAIAVVMVASVGLWWATTRDSRVAFLPADGTPEWVVFPRSARIGIRPAVELETRFRGTFHLDGDPETATLRFRAFRSCEITINGSPISLPEWDGSSWKRLGKVGVESSLQAGENEILVRVRNDRGPPALWLELTSPAGSFETDASWSASLAGSTWRAVEAARDGYDPARIDPEVARVRPWAALRTLWPTLLMLAGIAAGAVIGVGVLSHAMSRQGKDPRRTDDVLLRGFLALVVASWILIFVNNAPSLWIGDGFDTEGHVPYIQFILDHGKLPAADQGWSMFQPPVYYLAAAATLKLVGLSTRDPGAGEALRMLGLVIGIAQLLLVHGCLGRILPGQPRARAVGLIVAACLPLQLYTFQYVGNDGMAAMLATAVVYVGLRILASDRASAGGHALLGALMGAAVLTKLSALVVVAVVFLVMVGNRVRDRSPAIAWATSVGVTVGASLVVAGWHYARMAWRYGSPMAGNWSPEVHAPWWQDPGVLTASFYREMGAALSTPLLSAYNSLADGIYTTLWGDGSIGGRGEVALAPPWNLDLMAAGYVLALVPTLLALVGAGVLVARLVRRPDSIGFVVVGMAAATALALIVWPLKIPIYSVVKASFGMPALVSLCAFAGAGFDACVGRRRVGMRWLGWVVIGTWGLCAMATFWVPRSDPRAEGRLGWIQSASAGTRHLADAHLSAALDADPHEPLALLGRARLSAATGHEDEAIAQLRALTSWHGDFVRGRLELARLLSKHRRFDDAREQLRAALEISPDLAQAHSALGEILSVQGERERAIEHYREALRVVPDSDVVHGSLGELLLEVGREEEGRHHLSEAERLQRATMPGT